MIRNISAILLFNEEKKILLQHRTDDAPRLPDYWAFFGGGIEEGETPKEAVERETLEELEYALAAPMLIMKQKFTSAGITGTKYVFLEEYNPEKKLVLNEGKGLDWYKIDDALHLKMTDDDKEVLRYVKGKY